MFPAPAPVLRLLVVVSTVIGLLLVPHTPAWGAQPASASDGYRPPSDAPVADPFRRPAGPYAPGNRGIDYRTEPGSPVLAIGGGTVVFAGRVGAARWVTVLHPDGLRSSYGPLATIEVARNASVIPGQRLGTTAAQLHLGVRAGSIYLDPGLLFGAMNGRRRVRLVPVPGGIGVP